MKKVLILGAGGMLGHQICMELQDGHDLVVTVRNGEERERLAKAWPNIANHRVEELELGMVYDDYLNKRGNGGDSLAAWLDKVGEVDQVINAVGVTIPYSLENPAMTFFINSAWPHLLSERLGTKLIHITTDCVYQGKEGWPYDENSKKTPVDIYGLSKSLGEPINSLTIRTSIIGREIRGYTGLLEWFRQQEGQTIKGFTNHFWNGITTKQFGKICQQIIKDPDRYVSSGLYHVFSEVVSKYDMLVKFRDKYDFNCEIVPAEADPLNRTLGTVHSLCSDLAIPSFDAMLAEL